jgi:hypothetical protein
MTTHRHVALTLASCTVALWCGAPAAVMAQPDRPLRPKSTPLTPTPKQPSPPAPTSPPETPPPVNPMLDPNPPPPNVPKKPGTGAMVNLRPKFTKGQVIKFKMNMASSGVQTLPNIDKGQPLQPLKQSMTQELGLSLKVTETAANENTKADLVYDTVKLSMTTPDGSKVEFDSTKPPAGDADPIATMLKSLVGLSLTLTIDKDGNITSVDSSNSPLADSGMLKAFTGGDVVKNLFGPITTTSKSNGEARVGESWTNQDQIDAPWGKMNLATTHTLVSHRSSIASITINGRLTLEPPTSTTPVPAIRNSSYTGQHLWNTELGMLSEMTMRQHLELESAETGNSTQTMEVSVKRLP